MELKKISIIIPIFNEQENICLLYEQLKTVVHALRSSYIYEIIFINDGSLDGSWHYIKQLCIVDEHVKAISFSRNFGHQSALMAGYVHAQGDAVISMDADLQDPPSLLPEMISKWQQGFDIVYARRIQRKDSLLKQLSATLFYSLLNRVSYVKMPRQVGDFRLIDKKVVDVIIHNKERSPYLRGLVAWSGFNYTFIDFERPNRTAGQSGYTWKKMFKLGFDGLTGFSNAFLQIPFFIGLIMIILGMGMIGYACAAVFITNTSLGIATWLSLIMFNFMAMQFLCIGFLGQYLGRIYEQQKERPMYVIEHSINIDPSIHFLHQNAKNTQDERKGKYFTYNK